MVPADRMYEKCSATSTLCVRLMIAAQVYGGSLALVVGAHAWSYSPEYTSICSVGSTIVSGLRTELNNIRISGSQAGTYTTEGALLSRNHTFCLIERFCTSLIVLTQF